MTDAQELLNTVESSLSLLNGVLTDKDDLWKRRGQVSATIRTLCRTIERYAAMEARVREVCNQRRYCAPLHGFGSTPSEWTVTVAEIEAALHDGE